MQNVHVREDLVKLSMYINEVRTFPHTTDKINSKWFKDLNIIHNTIKLLEENIGKSSSETNCTSVFLGQSLNTKEIKAKISK